MGIGRADGAGYEGYRALQNDRAGIARAKSADSAGREAILGMSFPVAI
jgi:hypothetical protein